MVPREASHRTLPSLWGWELLIFGVVTPAGGRMTVDGQAEGVVRPDKKHWTRRLFVEEADVYLPFLEQAMDRAPAESTAVATLFSQHGVPAAARVLDVACGIGRHSIPLAQRGYRVTGIDISPLFVQKAKESAAATGADVRFMVGDVQEAEALLGTDGPFDGFISMFTSHGYYGRDGDLSLFRQLRRLASPEAVLVVLTSHRDWLVRNFEPEGLDMAGSIRIFQNRKLDLESSTIHNDWAFFEGDGNDLKLRLRLAMEHRVYSLHEFKELIEESGWSYMKALGSDRGPDFRLGELTLDSKTMWVVARAGE